MAAETATLCCTLLFVFIFVSAEQKTITAGPAQNVTLTCRAPNYNISIVVVKYSRADLRSEYVLLYRDDQFVPDDQHPSFKNRVDLQDRQMKDGDVSLILKDVTINDTGRYECHVAQRGPNQERAILELISIIYLSVVPPGPTGGTTEDGRKEDGAVGLILGLIVSAVLLVVAVVGFVIYGKHKQNQDPYVPPFEL